MKTYVKVIPCGQTLPRLHFSIFFHPPCSLLAGFQLGLADGRHQYYEQEEKKRDAFLPTPWLRFSIWGLAVAAAKTPWSPRFQLSWGSPTASLFPEPSESLRVIPEDSGSGFLPCCALWAARIPCWLPWSQHCPWSSPFINLSFEPAEQIQFPARPPLIQFHSDPRLSGLKS